MTGLSPDWKKSQRSNGSDSCVEARRIGVGVQVRDSKDRTGPVLTFSEDAWGGFLSALRAGALDAGR
jgi:hypothetical protein